MTSGEWMERFKDLIGNWWADASGAVATGLCWFTTSHCEYLTTLLAMLIGFFTLFFITIPKAIPNIKLLFQTMKRKK